MDDDCALFVRRGITEFVINDMGRTWPWPVKGNMVALSTYNNYEYYYGGLIQLVESKNRQLLMVARIFDIGTAKTTSFNVYKLTIRGSYRKKNWGSSNNDYEYYWKEINRLEENEALYIGWNDSISISLNVSNNYKSNHIYFIDQFNDGELCGYGMYDLENNRIQRIWDEDDSDQYKPENHEAGPFICRWFAPSIL